ncbi:hypothetical protein KTQ37_15480 [Sinorhodobacter sp. B57]|nr:hypothetical protein [Sedimentimonas flavescens]
MDGSEFLKTLHATEAEHHPLSSPECGMGILGSVAQPATCVLPVNYTKLLQCGTVASKLVRNDDIDAAMSLRCCPLSVVR